MTDIDHESVIEGMIDPEVGFEVRRGPFIDGDPADIVRIKSDGGFEPQYELGGAENRRDDVQVLVRSRHYADGRQVAETIRTILSPAIPEGYTSITVSQPPSHINVDDDDRHYFSARYLCRIRDEKE